MGGVTALVTTKGRVFAFDKDSRRLQLLQRNARSAGADHVHAEVADFLSVDLQAKEYSGVKGLLLDPSCRCVRYCSTERTPSPKHTHTCRHSRKPECARRRTGRYTGKEGGGEGREEGREKGVYATSRGADHVHAEVADFLSVDLQGGLDSGVQGLLLDPSCTCFRWCAGQMA